MSFLATNTTYEAPGLTLSTTNVEGTGDSIRSGATIAAFDATNPSNSAMGDSATEESAAVAARREHAHGREAFATSAIVLGRPIHPGSRRCRRRRLHSRRRQTRPQARNARRRQRRSYQRGRPDHSGHDYQYNGG